jgi:hypothetical protein
MVDPEPRSVKHYKRSGKANRLPEGPELRGVRSARFHPACRPFGSAAQNVRSIKRYD